MNEKELMAVVLFEQLMKRLDKHDFGITMINMDSPLAGFRVQWPVEFKELPGSALDIEFDTRPRWGKRGVIRDLCVPKIIVGNGFYSVKYKVGGHRLRRDLTQKALDNKSLSLALYKKFVCAFELLLAWLEEKRQGDQDRGEAYGLAQRLGVSDDVVKSAYGYVRTKSVKEAWRFGTSLDKMEVAMCVTIPEVGAVECFCRKGLVVAESFLLPPMSPEEYKDLVDTVYNKTEVGKRSVRMRLLQKLTKD